jgi:hypothetical protein
MRCPLGVKLLFLKMAANVTLSDATYCKLMIYYAESRTMDYPDITVQLFTPQVGFHNLALI